MKKIFLMFLFVLMVLIFAVVIVNKNRVIGPIEMESDISGEQDVVNNSLSENINGPNKALLSSPIDNPGGRVTKKRFGTYVTPSSSPVKPERFQGYHTGVDFEIFSGEENTDITVKAICSGKILSKRSASGYGGVVVQLCELNNEPVTVVYGHLKLESIDGNAGDELGQDDNFAILGKGFSKETDGERKHLHLAIHKGGSINILGYVSQKDLLSNWIDPCQYFCDK